MHPAKLINMLKLPVASFFLKNVTFFQKSSLPPFSETLCFSFSLFRETLPMVRGGSSVECGGEGEGTGVERCGGRWRQTRYADGGLTVADVRITYGSSDP